MTTRLAGIPRLFLLLFILAILFSALPSAVETLPLQARLALSQRDPG